MQKVRWTQVGLGFLVLLAVSLGSAGADQAKQVVVVPELTNVSLDVEALWPQAVGLALVDPPDFGNYYSDARGPHYVPGPLFWASGGDRMTFRDTSSEERLTLILVLATNYVRSGSSVGFENGLEESWLMLPGFLQNPFGIPGTFRIEGEGGVETTLEIHGTPSIIQAGGKVNSSPPPVPGTPDGTRRTATLMDIGAAKVELIEESNGTFSAVAKCAGDLCATTPIINIPMNDPAVEFMLTVTQDVVVGEYPGELATSTLRFRVQYPGHTGLREVPDLALDLNAASELTASFGVMAPTPSPLRQTILLDNVETWVLLYHPGSAPRSIFEDFQATSIDPDWSREPDASVVATSSGEYELRSPLHFPNGLGARAYSVEPAARNSARVEAEVDLTQNHLDPSESVIVLGSLGADTLTASTKPFEVVLVRQANGVFKMYARTRYTDGTLAKTPSLTVDPAQPVKLVVWWSSPSATPSARALKLWVNGVVAEIASPNLMSYLVEGFTAGATSLTGSASAADYIELDDVTATTWNK